MPKELIAFPGNVILLFQENLLVFPPSTASCPVENLEIFQSRFVTLTVASDEYPLPSLVSSALLFTFPALSEASVSYTISNVCLPSEPFSNVYGKVIASPFKVALEPSGNFTQCITF